MKNRLPDRGLLNQNLNKKPYNFTRSLAIYAALSALFAILLIASRAIGWNIGNGQQMSLFVYITMGMGFLIYLDTMGYKTNLSTKIYENKTMYIVCILYALMITSNFHYIDRSLDENTAENLWFIVQTLFMAVALEGFFRGYGDYIFEKKTKREEAAMIICYVGFNAWHFVEGTTEGIYAVVGAIGIGAVMTALYLRYHKIGANIAYCFIIYYLYDATTINSTSDQVLFGKAAPAVFLVSVIGMTWFGIKLIGVFNKEGIASEESLKKEQKDNDFSRAYEESKEKYKDKVIEKAEPKVEANLERYQEKQDKKNQKRREKAKRKAERKAEKGKGKLK